MTDKPKMKITLRKPKISKLHRRVKRANAVDRVTGEPSFTQLLHLQLAANRREKAGKK